MAPEKDFEPYVAESDLVADLPDGRTIQVAVKGQTVTKELLQELRVIALPRRVDEPSEHSPQADLEAAAATNAAVREGLVMPHNETQRQGVDQAAVAAHDITADAPAAGEQVAEVRAADEPAPDADTADAEKAKTSGKPRTAVKPAPDK